MATQIIRYVDADSTGGDGTTDSLSGATAAYASLDAALDAEYVTRSNLVSRDEVLTIRCQSTNAAHTADATAVPAPSFTTDATRYIEIVGYGTTGRHAGVWDATKYRLVASNSSGVSLNGVNYIRLDGLQIHVAAASANYQAPVVIAGGTAGGNERRLSHCILRGTGGASFRQQCVYINNVDSVVKMWNCVAYGTGTLANAAAAVVYANCASLDIYSCTLQGGQYGINQVAGTVTAKNVYAAGGSGVNAYNGTITMTNCAADDTTASGTSPVDNVATDTDTFVNVTPATEDFALAADGASPLKAVGVDTTGDTAPLNFTTDITAATRDATWDIGAFAWIEAAGGLSIPVAMHHYMHHC